MTGKGEKGARQGGYVSDLIFAGEKVKKRTRIDGAIAGINKNEKCEM